MRGLVRVGAAVPSLALGNVKENMKRHLAMMREAKEKHVSIVTFPELSLTGYTCGDLFFQRRLLDDVTDALLALKDEMPEGILAVVGAPLEIEGALYNCAVVLHDFFLYYAIRFGYPPKKVFDLCCIAFKDDFSCETILKWLKNFYRRFWTQQFKRNCMPDGVKIGSIALSPRGDWRMPSDAQYKAWMDECDCIKA